MDLSKIPELFAELVDVSWLVLMLEESNDTSDRRDDAVVRELLGDGVMACGMRPYSAKYGWARASAAVIRFSGSNRSIF